MEMSWNWIEVIVAQHCEVLDATELYIFKGIVVNFRLYNVYLNKIK